MKPVYKCIQLCGKNYFIRRVLGKGAFGVVFEGTIQGQSFAIKGVKTSQAGLRSDVVPRLRAEALNEINNMKALRNDPNVVNIYCHEEKVVGNELPPENGREKTERWVYMVLEFCLYDLASAIRHQALPDDLAQRFVKNLAAGLEGMFQQRIMHRDL